MENLSVGGTYQMSWNANSYEPHSSFCTCLGNSTSKQTKTIKVRECEMPKQRAGSCSESEMQWKRVCPNDCVIALHSSPSHGGALMWKPFSCLWQISTGKACASGCSEVCLCWPRWGGLSLLPQGQLPDAFSLCQGSQVPKSPLTLLQSSPAC